MCIYVCVCVCLYIYINTYILYIDRTLYCILSSIGKCSKIHSKLK